MNNKRHTNRVLVQGLYNSIKNNTDLPMDTIRYIKGSTTATGQSINTNRFTWQCQVQHGIKPTTSERYLRLFKAIDRV